MKIQRPTGGRLKIITNPPYSISEWNRSSFETDPYGRNFLGTPPQGRADYAFFQHILKSLKSGTGRCAILFPHGVLFRIEEADIRRRLIESDLIECIIGLGPNLFFNSPMEACIVICRTAKTENRRHKILFINAISEITRKNAQSYLEQAHIEKIASAFKNYEDEQGFSRVVGIEEISKNNYSLNIPLYARKRMDIPPALSPGEAADKWAVQRAETTQSIDSLLELLS